MVHIQSLAEKEGVEKAFRQIFSNEFLSDYNLTGNQKNGALKNVFLFQIVLESFSSVFDDEDSVLKTVKEAIRKSHNAYTMSQRRKSGRYN